MSICINCLLSVMWCITIARLTCFGVLIWLWEDEQMMSCAIASTRLSSAILLHFEEDNSSSVLSFLELVIIRHNKLYRLSGLRSLQFVIDKSNLSFGVWWIYLGSFLVSDLVSFAAWYKILVASNVSVWGKSLESGDLWFFDRCWMFHFDMLHWWHVWY